MHNDVSDEYDGPVIYTIQAQHGGPVKIGYSANAAGVALRLAALQTGNPYPLRVVRITKAPGGLRDEVALHERLAQYRLVGEWFLDCPEVAIAVGCPLPRRGDDGRRLVPVIEAAFKAGVERGRELQEADHRELVAIWLKATGEYYLSDVDTTENAAFFAARKACKIAGIPFDFGRSAHEPPTEAAA